MKVSGSYKSVVLGVSQQLPQDRFEGQHGDVVNLISDPVRGLVRRNGFVLDDAVYTKITGPVQDAVRDSFSFRTYSYRAGGVTYDVVYRSRPKGGSSGDNSLFGLHVYDKTPGGGGWVPLVTDPTDTDFLEYLEGGFSAVTSIGRYVLLAGNDSGSYPSISTTLAWDAADNRARAVGWVRGGAYSRKYSMRVRKASTQVEYNVSYTTYAAAYNGTLNTDDIPQTTPDTSSHINTNVTSVHSFGTPSTVHTFTINVPIESSGFFGGDSLSSYGLTIGGYVRFLKLVGSSADPTTWVEGKLTSQTGSNTLVFTESRSSGSWATDGGTNKAILYQHVANEDYAATLNERTAAYNTAVNQWLVAAAADIVPSNIATKLRDLLTAAGFTGWIVDGSHLRSADCDLIEVDSEGADDLFVAVGNTVRAADEVTPRHYVGKVVRVDPNGEPESRYYLKAFPVNEGLADTFQEVVWREDAGEVSTFTNLFAAMTVFNGVAYASGSTNGLNALVLAETGQNINAPTIAVPSKAGDRISNPQPTFVDRRIDAMFLFQDRLVVVSGSTLNMSAVGEYFNFYRSTVLTLPDNDPIEIYALGSEADTIRKAAVYDRNLILFGDQYLYSVSGRQVQTPQTASISVQLNISNTSYAQPVGVGQNVLFLKEDTQLAASRLMQVQAGLFQESPSVQDLSATLRDYINGTPAEIVGLTDPNIVFVRTEYFLKADGAYGKARPWGLYVYQWMDDPDQRRVQQAWSAWEWSSVWGMPVGISPTVTGDGIHLYTLAFGSDQDGDSCRGLMALSCSARPDPTGLPYLDGMASAIDAEATGLLTPAAQPAALASRATAFGAQDSYTAVPTGTDAARWPGIPDADYTVGDAPAQLVDPFRWDGVAGGYSQAQAAFPLTSVTNTWTGTQFPAYVDMTNPQVRDRDGNAITLGRLTLGKLRVTLTRSAGFKASWRDRAGIRDTFMVEDGYARKEYVNVWVGRDVNNVQVRLEAVKWLPLTISAIEWQGQWFAPRGRV